MAIAFLGRDAMSEAQLRFETIGTGDFRLGVFPCEGADGKAPIAVLGQQSESAFESVGGAWEAGFSEKCFGGFFAAFEQETSTRFPEKVEQIAAEVEERCG